MVKILIIGPAWVGDMVMSQSLYITLSNIYPNSSIDVLAPKWSQPLIERMPQVDRSIEMPIGHGCLNFHGRYKLGRDLKANQYTHAYVLPNSAKSALIPVFAQIPNRIGWKGEFRYGLINDLRNNKSSFQYMVERYVALAYPASKMISSESLGRLKSIPYPKLNIDLVKQKNILDKFKIIGSNNIGICPGAEFGPAKKWPEKHYAKVAQHAIELGKNVILFGSDKDFSTCEKIKSFVDEDFRSNVYNCAGKTSLIEAVDLLAACKTVVSNDSGLMHIAAAVGSEVIGIYGSTSPNYTPPLSERTHIINIEVPCGPCFKRECPLGHLDCLNKLTPDLVTSFIS